MAIVRSYVESWQPSQFALVITKNDDCVYNCFLLVVSRCDKIKWLVGWAINGDKTLECIWNYI